MGRSLVLLFAFSVGAEVILVDGTQVHNIGQAYSMLDTADGEADSIFIALAEMVEPRPVTLNGQDSLTVQGIRPCEVMAPNRLDFFRITARSNQELIIANLRVQPAWLPPRPEEMTKKHRSVEAMHTAFRVTLTSELRNFSLEFRDVAISASQQPRIAVPTTNAFRAMDWHYKHGITIAGRPQSSADNSVLLEGCEISHVTESGLEIRSDHAMSLHISDCLFAQANRQGLSIDAPGKEVVIVRTRVVSCNTGLVVNGESGGAWALRRTLFANNRADGIHWKAQNLEATIEASTFFGNGKLYGAAHSNHAGSGVFNFSNCIFAGAGRIAPGSESRLTLSNCNLVLAGPHSMRGSQVPYPPGSQVTLDKLVVDDPLFVGVDPFQEPMFVVSHDGYKALGITGFSEFGGGTPGEAGYADPAELDVARRRAAAPSERDAANWVWRYRMSGKALHRARAEAHFRGFLDVLKERVAKKADYSLAPSSMRQVCFAHIIMPDIDDKGLIKTAVANGLSSWATKSPERFPSGRSLLNAASCAMVAKAFPELGQAASLHSFANSAWEDWLRIGLLGASAADQTAALHGLVDLAFALDREAELKAESARLHRLSALIDNAGFRQSPSDFHGQTDAAGFQAYLRNELPGGTPSDPTAPWSRLAWLCKDPGFARTAARVAGGGQDAEPIADLLTELDVSPEPAPAMSTITRIGEFPERMVLAPKRGATDSYLGASLYERLNAYVNGHPDQLGAIYTFSSNGAILLGHGSRRSAGTANANTFIVQPPEAGKWQQNSASIGMMAAQFPSENWTMALTETGGRHPKRGMWTPAGDPSRGHAQFNPDGYIGLTDSLALDSVYIEIARPSLARNELAALGPMPVRFLGLSLQGAKGKDPLHSLNTLTGLTIARRVAIPSKGGPSRVRYEPLSAEELNEFCRPVEDEKLGACLEVTLPPTELGLVLKISDLARRFHIRDDFDRLAFSHRVLGERKPNILLYLNAHSKPRYTRGLDMGQPSTWPGRNQGGIVREATATMKNGDAWGRFAAENCYGTGSRWQREIVLAAEGFAVVRDVFVAGEDLSGFTAGPIWHLGGKEARPQGNGHLGSALSTAWWQESPPQLFVHIQGGEGGHSGNKVFANSALVSGEPVSFISVLVPVAATVPKVTVTGNRVTVGARTLELPSETP